ncbi:unnamed protein product [Adineta ricciae]|uniref:Transmembrane protein n=2 Tax=Adineta ricciae TaxID=249248 RepID=A0A815PRW4_ADIRI|nr:unnamed protein product [Adineta ricciae]
MFEKFILLSVVLSSISCQIVYDTNDDNAHGVRIAGNDQFIIFAINLNSGFSLAYSPFTPKERCSYSNASRDLYVYSVDVVYSSNNRSVTFVQIAEQTSTQNVYFSIVTIDTSSCNNMTIGNITIRDTLIWNGTHQEFMLLKVSPSQKYAYVVADSFVLKFDITQNRIVELKASTSFYQIPGKYPHAMDLTEDWALIAAYVATPGNSNLAAPIVFLCSLNPLRLVGFASIFDGFLQTISFAKTYNLANHMSISVNKERQMAIAGYPLINLVSLFIVNATSIDTSKWMIERVRTDFGPSDSGFGQSVAWIDNETVAIDVLSANAHSWSKSEVWTFAVDSPFTIPQYVFPNNQQTLTAFVAPRFYQILSWSKNLFILTEFTTTLFVPSQLPGYLSVWTDTSDVFMYIFGSSPCPPGKYKKENGFGLCQACPPQTRNPAYQPCTQCLPCSSNSFCPLGSITDVFYNNYSSYTQTYTYPDSPDMNNYDDLLVQNIFAINTQCLRISPLFWTLIVMTLCCITWFLMTIGKVAPCQLLKQQRNRAKKFLKNTDIVGEGERWIGGLFSFAIVVLFGFTFWFADDYLKLYPIETSSSPRASCDSTLRNAVFDNALQLPLPNVDGTRWPIFDMLDNQPFTMTLDLINTAATCQDLTVQQNRPGVNYLRLTNISCQIQPDNVTTSTTFLLPSHQTTVQINITGSYFVGGVRLCLRAPGDVNDVNTLEKLDTCQFFYTQNETLARTSTLSVVLVKVVNQTKPLTIGHDTYFTGRWTPTFGEYSISDRLAYEQDGEYLRYVSERTTLAITVNEQPFFLQNNQRPIVRIAELSFHTLLFCTLIIELFAMAFLLIKLIGTPLLRAILRCRHRHRHKSTLTDVGRNSEEKRKQRTSMSIIELRRLLQQYQRKKQRQNRTLLHDTPYTISNMSHESIRNNHQRTAF